MQRYNALRNEINAIKYKNVAPNDNFVSYYKTLKYDREPTVVAYEMNRLVDLGVPSGMDGIIYIANYIMPEWNSDIAGNNYLNGEIGMLRNILFGPTIDDVLYVINNSRGRCVQIILPYESSLVSYMAKEETVIREFRAIG